MATVRNLKIALLAIAAATAPAAAYQIGSHVPTREYYNLHETFTSVARQCLGATGNPPADCSSRFGAVAQTMAKRQGTPANTDEYASRWPDDPTRMLDLDPTKARFGILLWSDCKTALNNGPAIDDVGLLCSSHYGRLQFMHAQAIPADGGLPETTRANILAWAMFAYRAATDRQFRAKSYCKAVAEDVSLLSLREALSFSDRTFCDRRRKSLLGLIPFGWYEGWKVGTFFALQCRNPVQERVCWERTGDYGDKTARMAARGALLHLIQDSFSQSHVARVPHGEAVPGARGPFAPRVVCERPSAFYDYRAQNLGTPDDRGQTPSDPHAVADFPPAIHPNCLHPQRKVDDILTATATVLHFLHHHDAAAFEDYLKKRVFPG